MYRLPFTQGVWQAGYETNLIPEGYNHYGCGHVTVFKQRYVTIRIGNGVDSVDFIETFRVIVFHAH